MRCSYTSFFMATTGKTDIAVFSWNLLGKDEASLYSLGDDFCGGYCLREKKIIFWLD